MIKKFKDFEDYKDKVGQSISFTFESPKKAEKFKVGDRVAAYCEGIRNIGEITHADGCHYYVACGKYFHSVFHEKQLRKLKPKKKIFNSVGRYRTRCGRLARVMFTDTSAAPLVGKIGLDGAWWSQYGKYHGGTCLEFHRFDLIEKVNDEEFKITGPGTYKTRDGRIAHVEYKTSMPLLENRWKGWLEEDECQGAREEMWYESGNLFTKMETRADLIKKIED